jgi:hypothetical protein
VWNLGRLTEAMQSEFPQGQQPTATYVTLSFMAKRSLRVVKWLSSTPAIGVCEFCTKEFKAPLPALAKTADAHASLQEQFERHKCQPKDAASTRRTA